MRLRCLVYATTVMEVALMLVTLMLVMPVAEGFVFPVQQATMPSVENHLGPLVSSRRFAASSTEQTTFTPIFDFSSNTTVEKFERLDDAIMGGISTSTLRNVPNEPSASWSGVCRIDGGGFCVARTLPFQEPLLIGNDTQGFYLDCRLASDDESERRVWKMTTRSERTRGEELYQASFVFPSTGSAEWARIKVPFEDFVLVRGPRLVDGGPPLNPTGGLYQIGLSLSKFQISRNTTEIDNFRPGFFQVLLKEIGVYSNVTQDLQVVAPNTLTNEESKRKRSLIVKMLMPIAKVLFSEQSQRRRSAMKILRGRRGLSRLQAMRFGIRQRAKSDGMVRSLLSLARIVLVDSFRTVALLLIRYGAFVPIRLVARLVILPGKLLSGVRSRNQAKST